MMRRSGASTISNGPAPRAIRAPMDATRSSTATRQLTAHPAEPAPRRAWRNSPPRASCASAMISSMKASSAACSKGAWRARPTVGNVGGHSAEHCRLGADAWLQHDLCRPARPLRAWIPGCMNVFRFFLAKAQAQIETSRKRFFLKKEAKTSVPLRPQHRPDRPPGLADLGPELRRPRGSEWNRFPAHRRGRRS